MALSIDHSHSSPNHSSRAGADIDMLVLHATVGSYASSLAWLTNPASQVSTHYLISKSGHIAQLVDDSEAAWHAGKSTWLHRDSDDIRNASIGIELENLNDGRDPYPAAQLDACRALCRGLIAKYFIVRMMVVRHLDIAPSRKSDPAGLPWPAFRDSLYTDLPPADPFAKWGPIGKPSGVAVTFAVPKAWLMNQILGACVVPETYSLSGKYSVTEFMNGLIIYYAKRNAAEVELF